MSTILSATLGIPLPADRVDVDYEACDGRLVCPQPRLGGLWAVPGAYVEWTTHAYGSPQISINGVPVSTAVSGSVQARPGDLVTLSDLSDADPVKDQVLALR
jgi:hypothetical protein